MVKKTKQRKKKTKPNNSARNKSLLRDIGDVILDVGPELLGGLLFPASGARAKTSGQHATASPQLALGYAKDMALSAPAANGTFTRQPRPKLRTTSKDCVVTHREYVQDIWVQGNDMFDILFEQPINPGNATMFPWLSNVATNYETYRFERLDFIFEPQASTGNGGTIMMAVDYDAVDLAPVSKLAMMNYKDAVQSPPWFACVFHCAPADLHKYNQYYMTQSATTPTTTDEKTYFVGNMYLAATTSGDPFIAGSLYIEYTVRLFTPQVNNITSNASYFVLGGISDANTTLPGYLQITQEGGTLDAAIDYSNAWQPVGGTRSIEVIIPRPGAYQINLVSDGIPLDDYNISTASPPSGFFQSSYYTSASFSGSSDAEVLISSVVNLRGQVWFEITFDQGLFPPGSTAPLFLSITPIDQNSLEAILPLLTPPAITSLTKLAKYKKRAAGKAKPQIVPNGASSSSSSNKILSK